jgi:hypothetical protein
MGRKKNGAFQQKGQIYGQIYGRPVFFLSLEDSPPDWSKFMGFSSPIFLPYFLPSIYRALLKCFTVSTSVSTAKPISASVVNRPKLNRAAE